MSNSWKLLGAAVGMALLACQSAPPNPEPLEPALGAAMQAGTQPSAGRSAAELREAESPPAATHETQAQVADPQADLKQALEPLAARSTRRGMVLTVRDTLFEAGGAALRPQAQALLDSLAGVLQRHPQRRLLIEGFSDAHGSEATSLALSLRRAQALGQALLERGVDAQRLETQAYGAAHPVADNATAAGRRQNRRVELVVSDLQGQVPTR